MNALVHVKIVFNEITTIVYIYVPIVRSASEKFSGCKSIWVTHACVYSVVAISFGFSVFCRRTDVIVNFAETK